jgi:BirA family transcriptional regulator, biotin operon repressor / biotin---[acetyl-CoA-carboxylase] ligase
VTGPGGAPVPTDLAPGRIHDRLRTRCFGRSLEVVAETASTMDDAREAAARTGDGHVILADRQRRGRGAHGRRWESPGGTDLYLSIVVHRPLPPASRPLITLAMGLGVAEAIDRLRASGHPVDADRARIKWPNDVWLHGRKCAGILVETRTEGARAPIAVVGIGLNVNRRSWPPELAPHATSIAMARQDRADVDRADALATLLEHTEAWLDRLAERGGTAVTEALAQRLALHGDEVTVDGVRGVLVGVAPSGAVRLSTHEGIREMIAGTLRPVNDRQ